MEQLNLITNFLRIKDKNITITDEYDSNRPITKYIEKGSKVLSTLEPFSIYTLS